MAKCYFGILRTNSWRTIRPKSYVKRTKSQTKVISSNFTFLNLSLDIPTLEPVLLTELPDPKYYNIQGQKRQNLSCHGGPIVDLKWMPKGLEVAKRNLFGDPYQKDLKGYSGQFVTLSSNGELFIWSTKFSEDRDPRKQDIYKFQALHGF